MCRSRTSPAFRALVRRFAPEALPANMALVAVVKSWAREKNATPVQLALAWLLAQEPWIVPIPGTTNMAHMEENIGAAEIGFTPDDLRRLNADVASITILGEQLAAAVMQMPSVEAPLKH